MPVTRSQTQAEALKLQQINAVINNMEELKQAAIEDNRVCGLALGGWDLTKDSQWQAMLLFYKYNPPVADITTPEGALVERNRAFLLRMHELIEELSILQYGQEVVEELREMRNEVPEY
jgi:hypothetical protein